MARLRKGRANTVRGAAHFLRETVGRVRYGGARGQLTVRADSGFYTHAIVAVCRKMDVRYSITVRQHARLRNIIEAIPETDWTPIPYWMDGAADVAEHLRRMSPTPHRCVRRVKPTPGSQLALFASYSYHGFITDRDAPWKADHRRHAEIIRDLKYGVGLNHLPSGRFAAMRWTWPATSVATGDHQDPPTTLLLPRRTAHPLGAPPHFASSPALALGKPFSRWLDCEQFHSQPDGTAGVNADGDLTHSPDYPTASQTCARLVPERLLLHTTLTISPSIATAGRHRLALASTCRPTNATASRAGHATMNCALAAQCSTSTTSTQRPPR